MAGGESLQAGPALEIGERDESEVARRQHDGVVGFRRRRGGRVAGTEHHLTVDGPAPDDRGDEPAEPAVVVADGVAQHPVEVAPALGAELRALDVVAPLEQRCDEVAEGEAVALQEGGALGLAVVGEHHHVVGPGGLAEGPLQPGQLLVEPPQRLQRVVRGDPGVVGHLVVPHEVDIGGRHAAVDVAQQGVDGEVAQDHGRDRSEKGIDAPAVLARLDVAPAGPPCRRQLAPDVGEAQDEKSRNGVGVTEEIRQPVPARARPVGDRAEREHRVAAVAGEDVGARHPTVDEQPVAIGLPPFDLRRVAGSVRRENSAGLLVVPAKGGHVGVVAMEDPRLTRPGLRRQVALPSDDAVAPAPHPPRQCRQVALAEGAPQHRLGQPVDLKEQQPGDIGRLGSIEAAHHSAHHVAPPHHVVVDGEEAAGDRRHRGHPERGQHCGAEIVDVEAVDHLCRGQQDQAVGHQAEKPGGPHDERGGEPGHERPDNPVEHADHAHRQHRGSPGVDAQAREQARHHAETEQAHQGDDDDPTQRGTRQLGHGRRSPFPMERAPGDDSAGPTRGRHRVRSVPRRQQDGG